MNFKSVFIGLWLAWAAYWALSAIGNKPTAYRAKAGWKYSSFLAAIALFALFSLFPHLFRHRLLPPGAPLKISGAALTALGLAVSVWARVMLGRNWSATPTIKEGHDLIQAGPYRFVRHPIYTGLLLAIFGTCLANGRVRDLVIFAAITLILIGKLLTEESLMLRQFPEAYPTYRKRTKALIPFVI